MMKNILLSAFLISGTLSAQSSIGLDINGNDLEILGSYNFNSEIGYTGGTSYLIDASYLYNENEKSLVGIGVSGENSLTAAEGLILGFGAKMVFAEDYAALPLLAKATFILPFDNEIPTTSIRGLFAYAPSVLTFSDGESYLEYRFEGDMEVISNIHIFAGYRNIDTDYERKDLNFNDSWYGGLKLSF